MRLPRFLTTVALIAIFGVPAAAGQGNSKLDKSLGDSIASGCEGTKSVIIRTTPGAREALRRSLTAQGRKVKGEFPALDAITADVSCADLTALAGFRETASVSDNANVHGHQLADEPVTEAAPELLAEETIDDGAVAAYSNGSGNNTNFKSTLSRLHGGAVGPGASDKSLFNARRARVFVRVLPGHAVDRHRGDRLGYRPRRRLRHAHYRVLRFHARRHSRGDAIRCVRSRHARGGSRSERVCGCRAVRPADWLESARRTGSGHDRQRDSCD